MQLLKLRYHGSAKSGGHRGQRQSILRIVRLSKLVDSAIYNADNSSPINISRIIKCFEAAWLGGILDSVLMIDCS